MLSHPRHPYTRGLLDALPRPDEPSRPLTPIGGAPPVLGARDPGCAFHPRCAFAEPGCSQHVPNLTVIAPQHELACPPDPLRAEVVAP